MYGRGLRTVLVVDDDPMLVRAVKRSLGADYRVLSASSVAEASAKLVNEKIDVAVVDLRLGTESGVEVLEVLRERPLVRTAVLSAAVTASAVARAGRLGVRAIASKPCSFRTLVEAAERAQGDEVWVNVPHWPHEGDADDVSFREHATNIGRRAVMRHGGNFKAAAASLKISRTRLYRLVRNGP